MTQKSSSPFLYALEESLDFSYFCKTHSFVHLSNQLTRISLQQHHYSLRVIFLWSVFFSTQHSARYVAMETLAFAEVATLLAALSLHMLTSDIIGVLAVQSILLISFFCNNGTQEVEFFCILYILIADC